MKNITTRNLAGGFLGGFLGILSGAFIHPIAIPLGCIIGVLIGFWFKEVRHAVIDGLAKTLSVSMPEINLGLVWNKAQSLGQKVRRWSRYHRLTWMRSVRQMTEVGYWCISLLGWIISSPFRLVRFCLSHPVMVARTIRALSIICTTVTLLIISYVIYPETDEIGRYALVLFLSGMSLMLSFFGAERLLEEEKMERLSNFFSIWSRYSRQGPVLYAVKSVVQHLLSMTTIVAMLFMTVLALFGGVASLLLFLLISLFMNALWIASSRYEHLLCVTVTLIITITSAILCSGYMHGIGLWFVALTTGVLSGLTTEMVRRIAVFAFNNTFLYKFLGDDFADENRPEELKFGITKWRVWKFTENLFDSFGQKLTSAMLA
jgi:hypothetical protein